MYMHVIDPLLSKSNPWWPEVLWAFNVFQSKVSRSATTQTTALKVKFVINSQRWYIAGLNAKPFTGLLMLPEAILVHSQPWNKDRKRLSFVSLQIKSPLILQPARNWMWLHKFNIFICCIQCRERESCGSQVYHYSLSEVHIWTSLSFFFLQCSHISEIETRGSWNPLSTLKAHIF